ncbi:MAG: polymerase subunit delta [Solirubrobacterales bacterium]|jgi:DNA polymerase-3 subunit delta'|nr:polymerase subunit delta [Solirubrobacterales bacterium]
MTTAIDSTTEHQARARVSLTAALASGPSHAYLFRGPQGAGKRAAARAFAAEILASAADDPDDVRRRALLDPSPHPDLVWLTPRGAQHLIEEVRERVIRAAAYRPFEGSKRVFVVEAAEALRDESQNALLKTLEEPPEFVHLILLSSEPEALLETIASRCQPVDFAPLSAEVLEAQLQADGPISHDIGGNSAHRPPVEEVAAAARLAAGDLERARLLLGPRGREVREDAERCVAAALSGEVASAPWEGLLDRAKAAGEEVEAAVREVLEEESKSGLKRTVRDIADESKRAGRRRRTEILDLGLELCAAWLRDLAAVASGAEEVAFNRDRLDQLRSQANGLDPRAARRGAEAVQETRRSLDLNVSEELALEALFFRLERELR